AEDTTFKVHRGVVARASEVMEAMFALPQSDITLGDSDMVEGCPVVTMYDDGPLLVSLLLHALYDGP
ncbi:hypothetical protein NG726_39510, partial [Pseudomonas sp. MOB-449]|nr:hypothetical protein [Pseudomonas sp. MOB-449]